MSLSSANPYCASLVGGTGGLRLAGSAGHAQPIDGSFGAVSTLSAPLVLNRPASGAAMPPKVSQGVDVDSVCSEARAASAVTGAGLLPPSM